MDLKRLRAETRVEHEATEAAMPLLAAELTREGYRRVLEAMLPVVQSWERWSEAHAPAEIAPLLAKRRRSGFLREDLESLGAEPQRDLAPLVDWNAVVQGDREGSAEGRRACFLGAMYVMEGSTLGGRFLAKHVAEVLQLENGQGNRYFRGHGDGTGALWREVTTWVAEVPEEGEAGLLGAARRTFAAFRHALAGVKAAGQKSAADGALPSGISRF